MSESRDLDAPPELDAPGLDQVQFAEADVAEAELLEHLAGEESRAVDDSEYHSEIGHDSHPAWVDADVHDGVDAQYDQQQSSAYEDGMVGGGQAVDAHDDAQADPDVGFVDDPDNHDQTQAYSDAEADVDSCMEVDEAEAEAEGDAAGNSEPDDGESLGSHDTASETSDTTRMPEDGEIQATQEQVEFLLMKLLKVANKSVLVAGSPEERSAAIHKAVSKSDVSNHLPAVKKRRDELHVLAEATRVAEEEQRILREQEAEAQRLLDLAAAPLAASAGDEESHTHDATNHSAEQQAADLPSDQQATADDYQPHEADEQFQQPEQIDGVTDPTTPRVKKEEESEQMVTATGSDHSCAAVHQLEANAAPIVPVTTLNVVSAAIATINTQTHQVLAPTTAPISSNTTVTAFALGTQAVSVAAHQLPTERTQVSTPPAASPLPALESSAAIVSSRGHVGAIPRPQPLTSGIPVLVRPATLTSSPMLQQQQSAVARPRSNDGPHANEHATSRRPSRLPSRRTSREFSHEPTREPPRHPSHELLRHTSHEPSRQPSQAPSHDGSRNNSRRPSLVSTTSEMHSSSKRAAMDTRTLNSSRSATISYRSGDDLNGHDHRVRASAPHSSSRDTRTRPDSQHTHNRNTPPTHNPQPSTKPQDNRMKRPSDADRVRVMPGSCLDAMLRPANSVSTAHSFMFSGGTDTYSSPVYSRPQHPAATDPMSAASTWSAAFVSPYDNFIPVKTAPSDGGTTARKPAATETKSGDGKQSAPLPPPPPPKSEFAASRDLIKEIKHICSDLCIPVPEDLMTMSIAQLASKKVELEEIQTERDTHDNVMFAVKGVATALESSIEAWAAPRINWRGKHFTELLSEDEKFINSLKQTTKTMDIPILNGKAPPIAKTGMAFVRTLIAAHNLTTKEEPRADTSKSDAHAQGKAATTGPHDSPSQETVIRMLQDGQQFRQEMQQRDARNHEALMQMQKESRERDARNHEAQMQMQMLMLKFMSGQGNMSQAVGVQELPTTSTHTTTSGKETISLPTNGLASPTKDTPSTVSNNRTTTAPAAVIVSTQPSAPANDPRSTPTNIGILSSHQQLPDEDDELGDLDLFGAQTDGLDAA
jgi:hypothetical protein